MNCSGVTFSTASLNTEGERPETSATSDSFFLTGRLLVFESTFQNTTFGFLYPYF